MRRLLLLLSLVLVAACGGGDDEGLAANAPAAPATSLTVTATVGGTTTTTTLECGPPGGDHPSPEAACAVLAEAAGVLAAPAADRACTEVYGGPEVARVQGTVDGRPVDRALDRANGCGISDWQALGAVLPVIA